MPYKHMHFFFPQMMALKVSYYNKTMQSMDHAYKNYCKDVQASSYSKKISFIHKDQICFKF